ncbi:hypothetical protein [Cellulomonas edaphi]|uniref:Uncharacterized protein n=1 Tax=Cellulomonas edaphi TaxID=3053468 RepID=A0ABT7S4N4_9CELL|nr:hypothetical protein [Cellulomons edaphi]MDM7830594.1 hypothetical protein [Cellulomons edaphi]
MGLAPLTPWDRAAFDDLRSRLHVRYDDALRPASFSVEAARRPHGRGLVREITLTVSGDRTTTHTWPVDTRAWTGTTTQDASLDQVEAEISAALDRVAR